MVFLRSLLFLFFFSSEVSKAAWYSTQAEAQAVCTSSGVYHDPRGIDYEASTCGTQVFADARCVGGSAGTYIRWMSYWGLAQGYSSNAYYCSAGYVACPAGTTRGADGNCACPAGQTLVNGQCTNACQAGTTKQLTVNDSTIYIGSGPVTSDGGCEYSCNEGVGDFVSTDAQGTYQTFMCSQTGLASTVNQSVIPPADAENHTAKEGCVMGVGKDGKTFQTCNTNPDTGCGQVNGNEVCYNGDSVQVNGQSVHIGDSKNCGEVNGEFLCVVPEEDADNCVSSVKGKTCFNSKTKQTSSTSKVTNPDGSVTETTTVTDNVKGHDAVVTVKVTNPDGSVSVSKQGGPSSTSDGVGDGLASVAKAVGQVKESVDGVGKDVKGIKDALTTGGTFSGQTAGGEHSLYQPTDKTFQGIMSDFSTNLQSQPIMLAARNAFMASFSSCGCPVFETGNLSMMGGTFNFKFDQLCSGLFNNTILPVVSLILGLIAALISLKIALL